jgi:hypothetical protein
MSVLSKDDITKLKINDSIQFLQGQLELYKIEFANTGDNKYIATMNDIKKSIEVIDFLDRALMYRTKQYIKLKR